MGSRYSKQVAAGKKCSLRRSCHSNDFDPIV